MLPPPGSPGASWAIYRARFRALFEGADVRVCIAFWLFGLINNVLYVIILSAALDLVGPLVPKGVVLLADVVPSFIVKLTVPYFIHIVPYSARILLFVGLSIGGMLLIAATTSTESQVDGSNISAKLAGIVLASLSSGGGELSFLGLTHFYGPFSLAAWGSGTGGAGLVGAGAYMAATTWFGWSVKASLLGFSLLPMVMLLSFFFVLPQDPWRRGTESRPKGYAEVPDQEDEEQYEGLPETAEGTLPSSIVLDGRLSPGRDGPQPRLARMLQQLRWHLKKSRHLFFPYMFPLLLVYVAEYTINQGVTPTLLFPLSSTPFKRFRSFYPTYATIYQLGVFISRSSIPFVRIHALYPPSLLQWVNLVLLVSHALFPFIPNVYCIFVVIFWEGLLGGAVYVNTFAEIMDVVPESEREFSLAATTVSDSAGICIAGVLGMMLEVWLCSWQVKSGRDYCRRT